MLLFVEVLIGTHLYIRVAGFSGRTLTTTRCIQHVASTDPQNDPRTTPTLGLAAGARAGCAGVVWGVVWGARGGDMLNAAFRC